MVGTLQKEIDLLLPHGREDVSLVLAIAEYRHLSLLNYLQRNAVS
jgi:hypothetical protein